MLKVLHIENIAVIECCDIELGEGFNVLTGETGAGKSIIIDAIGAVLGYRTTKDVVRNGADKASVSAVFEDISNEAKSWLDLNGFDSENGEVMISREITADGKSSARINGKPITATLLRDFGILLINILGQHDSQQLLNVETHALFVDRFAQSPEYSECEREYSEFFSKLCENKQELKRLDIDETAKARQVEMLKFQIDELEAANLMEDEDVRLLEKQKIIRESAKLTERVAKAYEAFSGSGEQTGVCTALGEASKLLSQISDFSEEMSKISESATELYYAADDISERLRDLLDSFDFSDEDADSVESRLDVIHKLKRKYGNSVAEMLEYLDKIKNELSEIEFSEEKMLILEKEIKELTVKAYNFADKLFGFRLNAAQDLESRITKELSELDMKNAKFVANVQKGDELTERGVDSVEFMLSANLGENAKPLEKIASGGELSRVMLAIKNALRDTDYVSTMIFDEIDTGVSGRAAQKIAEKLYKVSLGKQVLCVTHLAQLSAMSDIHFKIEKKERDGRTYTVVTPLDLKGREGELARITGGSSISKTTLENARELLLLAEEKKREIRNL